MRFLQSSSPPRAREMTKPRLGWERRGQAEAPPLRCVQETEQARCSTLYTDRGQGLSCAGVNFEAVMASKEEELYRDWEKTSQNKKRYGHDLVIKR